MATAPLTGLEAKLAAMTTATELISKAHGEDSVMNMGARPRSNVEVISTGSIGLDRALGVGGLPRGRITEIFGPESSGKTTLAIHVIAEAHKKDGLAVLIDAEHAFDSAYAETLGVDLNRVWVAQPDSGEQALDIAEQMINSGAVDVLVIDSVAALTPRDEIQGDMGAKSVGLHARLMSQAMRKLTASIARTNTVCIFINQLRDKIGVVMGNPETTTGGHALKFYSSVRIDIRASTPIKEKDETIGRLTKVKVVKNKLAPPFMRAQFDMIFGKGISRTGEVLDYSVEFGIVKKSGAWFSYNGSKLGQGRDAVKKVLEDNPELYEELSAKVWEHLNTAEGIRTLKVPEIVKTIEAAGATRVPKPEPEDPFRDDTQDMDLSEEEDLMNLADLGKDD